ncbi:hypothetical protein D3C81_1446040 [compost metagenome]
MAAARFSDSQDLAVPGSPISSSARSVTRVATAISIRRVLPMYLGVITFLPALPPAIKVSTERGDICHPAGILPLSSLRSASSSSRYNTSAGRRI